MKTYALLIVVFILLPTGLRKRSSRITGTAVANQRYSDQNQLNTSPSAVENSARSRVRAARANGKRSDNIEYIGLAASAAPVMVAAPSVALNPFANTAKEQTSSGFSDRHHLPYIVCTPPSPRSGIVQTWEHLIPPANKTVFNSEQLEKLPTRNLLDVASLAPGVYQRQSGSGLHIGGGRAENTLFIVDGIMVTNY